MQRVTPVRSVVLPAADLELRLRQGDPEMCQPTAKFRCVDAAALVLVEASEDTADVPSLLLHLLVH